MYYGVPLIRVLLSPPQKHLKPKGFRCFCFFRKKGNGDLFGGRPPPTGQAADLSFVVSIIKHLKPKGFRRFLFAFLNFLSGNLRNVLKMSYKKHLKLWLQVLFCL